MKQRQILTIAGLCILSIGHTALDAAGAALSRGRQIMLDRGLQIQALVGTHSDAVWVDSHFTTLTCYHNPTGAAYHLPSLIANEPRPGATLWGRTWDLSPASQNLTTSELPYQDRFVSFGYKDEVADPFDPARQAHMAATYATWNSLYPDTLTYMNHYGSLFNPTTLATYMANTNPDMIVFDSYVPQFYTKAQRYAHMQLHRTAGLAGIDGTGDMPIPYGQYLNMYRPTYEDPLPSESSVRLQYFDSWAFGFTWVSAYTFDDIDPFSSSGGDPVMFSAPGCGSPTQTFYDVAETNRQSRNLGPALVRMVSTDIRMIRGKVNGIPNDPLGIPAWAPGAGGNLYISGITPLGQDLAQPSTTNYSDVVIGYFAPLLGDNTGYSFVDGTHFMIVNSASTGTAAASAEWYHLTFNFTGSDLDSLVRLSRDTGRVELIPLTNTGESLYSLDLNLPGGTGDLFGFWNSSNPLPTMPEQDTIWTGIGGTTWSTATGLNNWKDSGGPAVDYANGLDVTFDDTATGLTADISAADVTPDSVLFNNSTKDFTVQGTQGIAGSTPLTKRGAGKVTLNSVNTYTGRTTIEAGTLELGLMAQSRVFTGGLTDIQGGELVLNYTGGSTPAFMVRLALATSYATGFASGQIYSSTATTALGLGWVDDTGASELTIAATWYGDIDLDGNVNFIDLSKFLAGYNQPGDWAQGDFDYNGSVTFADLSRMLANYNQSLPGSINVGSYNLDGPAIQLLADAGITVVPEPSSLLLLGMATLGLLIYARCRRRT